LLWTQTSLVSSHTSVVQGLPSVHVFATWVQTPVAGVQPSVVQNRLSSQLTAVPGTHEPVWQVSTPLQRLPSAQSASTVQVAIEPRIWKIWSGSVWARQVE